MEKKKRNIGVIIFHQSMIQLIYFLSLLVICMKDFSGRCLSLGVTIIR